VRLVVTGADGRLGGAIATRLEDAGHDVRPFGDRLNDDLIDAGSVRRACEGREAVVHAAVESSPWLRDRRAFDRINVQGFGRISEAARTAGIRLLYICSYAALGPTDGCTFDEKTPRATLDFQSDHERTLWVADQMARHLGSVGMDIVRLYPGVLFGGGPEGEHEDMIGLLVRCAAGGSPRMPGGGRKRQCFAYVEDVVDGVAKALRSAPRGSAYILGGENRTAREFVKFYARAAGLNGRWRGIPMPLAAAAGRLRRWYADLSGMAPRLPESTTRFYAHEWAYSSEKAVNELGYRITPFEEAIASMVRR
jgi:nucleoside-diphosphate-sugar epimerase